MILVVHPGSGSWFFTHPGSRIQGSKRHRIPDTGIYHANYGGPGFLPSYDLTPPPLFRFWTRPATHRKTEKERQPLTGEFGEGVREELTHTTARKPGPLWIIPFSLSVFKYPVSVKKARDNNILSLASVVVIVFVWVLILSLPNSVSLPLLEILPSCSTCLYNHVPSLSLAVLSPSLLLF